MAKKNAGTRVRDAKTGRFQPKGTDTKGTDKLPNYRKLECKTDADIIVNNGVDKCLNKDYQEGIADFTQALRLNPNHRVARFNKGLALIQWGYSDVLAGHDKINSGMNELSKDPDIRERMLQEVSSSFKDEFSSLRYLE